MYVAASTRSTLGAFPCVMEGLLVLPDNHASHNARESRTVDGSAHGAQLDRHRSVGGLERSEPKAAAQTLVAATLVQ